MDRTTNVIPLTNPARLEEFRNRMARQGTHRIVLADDWTIRRELYIPTDLDSWYPTEITKWLSDVEDDATLSDQDVRRARKAVDHSLGVD